eukprot:CAMPEP_0194418920 /NCGR_PEP_ID=MMETSP0176-20130528/18120_1 /TAXON_ID=216777 /ORGANISM="Proboscia alata, Strain PI-D3" /LENGTH=184 /DNA_ID=CAMNT_0039225663 /DNA_START=105 /DNA_END=656 /DNA_ORIENTATION=+
MHEHATQVDSFERPFRSHQVVEIIDNGGIDLLCPIMDMSFIAFLALYVQRVLRAQKIMLLCGTADYFFDLTCPVVKHLQHGVFQLDSSLFTLLKNTLNEWCIVDDAFIKLFLDAWVRGVMTQTDSFGFMLAKSPSAIAAFLVVYTFTPLLSIPYAILASIIRSIELRVVPNTKILRTIAFCIKQ